MATRCHTGPMLLGLLMTLPLAAAPIVLPAGDTDGECIVMPVGDTDGENVYSTVAALAALFDKDPEASVTDSDGDDYNVGAALIVLLTASKMLVHIVGKGWRPICEKVVELRKKLIGKEQKVKVQLGGVTEHLTIMQATAKAAADCDAIWAGAEPGAAAGGSSSGAGPSGLPPKKRNKEGGTAEPEAKAAKTGAGRLQRAIAHVLEAYTTVLLTTNVIYFYSFGAGNDTELSSMATKWPFDGRELTNEEAVMLPFLVGKVVQMYFTTRELLFQFAKMECAGAAGDIDPVKMRDRMRNMTGPQAQQATNRYCMKFRNGVKEWDDEYRFKVMVVACVMQAEGNPEFEAKLLGTGDALLAEAKSNCRWWGIGHKADEAANIAPADRARKWGANHAGKALMVARHFLRESKGDG